MTTLSAASVRVAIYYVYQGIVVYRERQIVPINALYNILLRHIPGVRELVRVFIKPAKDWRICHTDTFDWWHPYYNHYHTLDELRAMVNRADLNLVSDDVPYNSVRAVVPAANPST